MPLAALLLLGACTQAPTIDGKVVDIWGEPIPDATVLMVGTAERPLTDKEGRYSFTFSSGKHTIKAGKEGYIQEHADVEFAEGQPASGPTFTLHRKPDVIGFFAIGPNDYVHIAPQTVHTVGSDFDPLRGLKSVGSARVDDPNLKVVYHAEVKYEDILRLGLELHRLEFVKERELSGPLGHQQVTVNLYASKAEVPIEITPMHSPTDYMITTKAPLEPGYYAFQALDLLDTPDQESFDRIPEQLRQVFPFEVK